ncbi:MAG: spermidine/putrescine ABC transporter ATP-binding protein, partial [Alphaproteobacteria bacterium HGW-Alphaproteobacteria-8]
LAVRPEQIRVVAGNAPGAIAARITGKVYFGTDTHYHFALADGTEVVARLQSRAQGEDDLSKGAEVGLQFEDNAVQVLGL